MRTNVFTCDVCGFEERVPCCGQDGRSERQWFEVMSPTLHVTRPGERNFPWHFCSERCLIEAMQRRLEVFPWTNASASTS